MNYWVDLHVEKKKTYHVGDFVFWRKSKHRDKWRNLINAFGPHSMIIKKIFWTFDGDEYCLFLILETIDKQLIKAKKEDVCFVEPDFLAF